MSTALKVMRSSSQYPNRLRLPSQWVRKSFILCQDLSYNLGSLDFNSNSDGLKTSIYEDLVKSLKNSVRQLL